MYIFFTILIVIASVLLTLLVLVQNSKGGGLAAGFQSSNQVMGVRKTTDFLEKATWGLVAFVLVASIVAVGFHKTEVSANNSEIQQQYKEAQKQMPTTATPGFGETAPETTEPAPAPAPAN